MTLHLALTQMSINLKYLAAQFSSLLPAFGCRTISTDNTLS